MTATKCVWLYGPSEETTSAVWTWEVSDQERALALALLLSSVLFPARSMPWGTRVVEGAALKPHFRCRNICFIPGNGVSLVQPCLGAQVRAL